MVNDVEYMLLRVLVTDDRLFAEGDCTDARCQRRLPQKDDGGLDDGAIGRSAQADAIIIRSDLG